jgi:hypothetical protein
MKKLSVSIAAALLLTAGVANAATLSINPAVATAQPGAGNGTSPTTITVNWDNTGPVSTIDSIDTDVTYDGADLSVTVTGNCSANNPGVVIVSIADGNSNPIASGPLCTMTFTTLAGAADGESKPIALTNIVVGDGGVELADPPSVDGVINIQSTPIPLTLAYNPAVPGPVNIPNGGNNAGGQGTPQTITATVTGNSGTASLTGCAASAGFSVTPAALNFVAGGAPQDLTVGCTLTAAAQTGTLTCTETDGDSAGVQRQWNLNCAAGFVPPVVPTITTVSPAPGSTSVLPTGQPGAVVSSLIDFSSAGGAGAGTGTINCSATAPLTINPNGNQNVVGAAQPVDVAVSCTLTDTEQLGGSVTCAITDLAGARTETFGFTCPAGQAIVAPSQPAIIPTNSLWSKLSLIGLLAALGVLVVGLRRQH